MSYAAVIDRALKASSLALRESFGKLGRISEKGSPVHVVTEGDLASEQELINCVERECPEDSILSEEAGYVKKKSKITWIIDPLDGSSNFAAGLPWFGSMIAVLEGATPVAAGISIPNENKFFIAERGRGTFRNGIKVSVSNEKDLKRQLVSFNCDASSLGEASRIGQFYGSLSNQVRNLRSTNSAYDLVSVADGKIGACILHHARIWDVVAPAIIIEESGGIARSLSGETLKFDLSETGIAMNYSFIAGNSILVSEILKLSKTSEQ